MSVAATLWIAQKSWASIFSVLENCYLIQQSSHIINDWVKSGHTPFSFTFALPININKYICIGIILIPQFLKFYFYFLVKINIADWPILFFLWVHTGEDKSTSYIYEFGKSQLMKALCKNQLAIRNQYVTICNLWAVHLLYL